MSVIYTVNGKKLHQEIVTSLAQRNNPTQIKNSLRLTSGQSLVKKFESMKRSMVREFLNLPVTKEILAGPGATNTSGTLGGYGNLFSFIGFDAQEQPIEPIITLLNQTSITVSKISRSGSINVRITMPSKNDIFAVTPLPWATGISWAQRIELGLSGLGVYFNKESASSRSSMGVQIENKIRPGAFTNVPYVSQFIKRWHNLFLKIEKQITL
jgi:hypothetical protein